MVAGDGNLLAPENKAFFCVFFFKWETKGIRDSWAKITLSPKLGDLTSFHQFPFTVGTPGIYSKKPWICWSGGS